MFCSKKDVRARIASMSSFLSSTANKGWIKATNSTKVVLFAPFSFVRFANSFSDPWLSHLQTATGGAMSHRSHSNAILLLRAKCFKSSGPKMRTAILHSPQARYPVAIWFHPCPHLLRFRLHPRHPLRVVGREAHLQPVVFHNPWSSQILRLMWLAWAMAIECPLHDRIH